MGSLAGERGVWKEEVMGVEEMVLLGIELESDEGESNEVDFGVLEAE